MFQQRAVRMCEGEECAYVCVCVCVCACIALLSAIRSNAHRHAQHADIQQPLQVKATNIVEMMGIKGLVKVMLILKKLFCYN